MVIWRWASSYWAHITLPDIHSMSGPWQFVTLQYSDTGQNSSDRSKFSDIESDHWHTQGCTLICVIDRYIYIVYSVTLTYVNICLLEAYSHTEILSMGQICWCWHIDRVDEITLVAVTRFEVGTASEYFINIIMYWMRLNEMHELLTLSLTLHFSRSVCK